jgi:iron complex outermembrane receptor protein
MKRFIPLALALAGARVAAEQLPLEHVLVSVPMHKKAAETALPVTVVSGDELRRMASSTIGDTLANSPGLANASFGPGVGQPVIRGQAGPRVTVLQNGTSSADASNISADHATAVEPLLADSVEVLRGPATLLYGGGAIGGVVNVIDNRIPATLEQDVSLAGEYRHDSASSGDTLVLRADGGAGSFAWHVDGLLRDWDNVEIPGAAALPHQDEMTPAEEDGEDTTVGFIDNSDGRTRSLTLGGSYHFEDGFLGLAFSRLDNEYGIPPGGHGHPHEHDEHGDEEHGEDEHDDESLGDEEHGDGEHGDEEIPIRLDVKQARYDAALHLHDPVDGIDVVRGFLTYTDYQHVELEGAEVGTRYSNETWEGRLEAVHGQLGNLHGSFGLQAKSGQFSALGEESFIPVTDSAELGLFLVEDWHAGNWTVEGGGRLDWVERDPDLAAASAQDFTAVSLSASVLWDFAPRWQLGLALMRAQRAPAIEELYSNIAVDDPEEWVVHAASRAIELGDQGLDVETSRNADLSLDWDGGQHFAHVSVFYNDFADYINLANTGVSVDEVPVLAYVQEDARFYGAELESEFTLARWGDGQLRLGLGGDVIRGELDSGDDVPRLPPRRLHAKLEWSNERWLLWGRVLDATEQDRPGVNEEPTPGYTRWDAGGEYRTPLGERARLVLFLNLRNIGDEDIRLSTSFLRDFAPEAGRSLEGGVRLLF